MNNQKMTAYLAPIGFEELLQKELSDVTKVCGRLMLTSGEAQPAYWAQNIWYDPSIIPIKSIGEAAKALRAIQRNWWPYEFQHHRRMKLIQEKLPYIAPKPLDFLSPIPNAPLGSWTLIDENTVLAASHCSSPLPNGEFQFNEDKINPPSRAYLKLWEFFTRFQLCPTKNDICIDLGASPGGWTWVLAKLAKQVIAYDRSPLDERIASLKNVSFKAEDAFKVKLSEHPEATWVFSDVICYPDKLYEFVTALLRDYPDKKYLFTIKFQGADNREVISRFASLPGKLVHLSQNKHELTWFKV